MGSVCERPTANRRRSTKNLMPMVMLQQMVAAAILLQALPTTHGFTNKQFHFSYGYRMRDRSSLSTSSCTSLSAMTQPPSSSSTLSGGGITRTTGSKEQTSQSVPDADIATEQSRPLDVNIVLIDNYDSYTYNLYQYLACICVKPPVVVANDAYESWEELVEAESTSNRRIDAVVISPGPGTPTCEKDVGICQEVVRSNPHLPILGVCLGHQLLGHHYGANVTLSPGGPVHGMVSPVGYDSDEALEVNDDDATKSKWNLFDGIEQDFGVVRYHSLAVQFPSEESDLASLDIEPMAWCDAAPPSAVAKNDDGPTPAEESVLRNSTKVCMALRHKSNPHYGVQFHPESIGTGRAGYQILYNFCRHVEVSRLAKMREDLEGGPSTTEALSSGPEVEVQLNGSTQVRENSSSRSMHTVHIHKISPIAGSPNPRPEVVFGKFYGSSPSAFWLDSSTGEVSDVDGNLVDLTADKPKCPIRSNSRFSIMGDDNGPLSKRVEYYGEDHEASERGTKIFSRRSDKPSEYDLRHDHDSILEYLRKSMGGRGVSLSTRLVHFDNADGESYTFEDVDEFSTNDFDNHGASSSALPFEYRGGYVGYLGYEVRHDSRKFLCEQEICNLDNGKSPSQPSPQIKSDRNIPTAAFLFADRSLVYDHFTSNWYLVGVSSNEIFAAESGGVVSTVEWMRQTSAQLQSLQNQNVADSTTTPKTEKISELSFHLDRSKARYEKDIRRCHEEIKNGESYELCLTNQLRSTVVAKESDGPFGLYKILRRRNPAPFSAFLRLDRLQMEEDNDLPSSGKNSRSASVSICCSSPERFLSVSKLVTFEDAADSDDVYSHGWEFAPRRSSDRSSHDLGYKYQVESKPIKGTTARIRAQDSDDFGSDHSEEDARVAEELRLDVKNRAENLMIVDLLRNDLSRVCEVGSVHVPRLMHIESFTTVHQLVSTIRGVINSIESNAADVISACFPGGSMTGAPKLRSVDILNEMEQGVSRGPYSGSLGYISLNGCMDMNIIIRTAVVTPDKGTGNSKEKSDKWNVSIGCGGAITALSDSEDEYNEMILKARAVKEAVEYWADN